MFTHTPKSQKNKHLSASWYSDDFFYWWLLLVYLPCVIYLNLSDTVEEKLWGISVKWWAIIAVVGVFLLNQFRLLLFWVIKKINEDTLSPIRKIDIGKEITRQEENHPEKGFLEMVKNVSGHEQTDAYLFLTTKYHNIRIDTNIDNDIEIFAIGKKRRSWKKTQVFITAGYFNPLISIGEKQKIPINYYFGAGADYFKVRLKYDGGKIKKSKWLKAEKILGAINIHQ